MTTHLSKSLLNNYRQCPRRLWLEMQDRTAGKQEREPLAQASYSADTQKRFLNGHVIGRIAKARQPQGIDIEAQSWVEEDEGTKRRDLGYTQHLTKMWLMHGVPLFEAPFSHSNLLVMADVMRPTQRGKQTVSQMIEVKSSATAKGYHLTATVQQTLQLDRWLNSFGRQIRDISKKKTK